MNHYIIDRLRESMVKILGSDGQPVAGSGFIIRSDGYLITCHHVIYLLDSLNVEYQGQISQAEWCEELSNPEVDIAILKIYIEEAKAVSVVNIHELPTSVIVYGFPQDDREIRTKFTEGFDAYAQNIYPSAPIRTISTYPENAINLFNKLQNKKKWNRLPCDTSTFKTYRIDSKVGSGTSGGLVFARDFGGVVGVMQCSYKSRDESYVIRWDNITESLDKLGLEPEKNAVCRFLEEIENNFKYIRLFHSQQPIVLKEQYIAIQVTIERKYKHEVETTWGYAEDETQLKRIYALKKVDEESRRTQVDWEEAKKQYQKIIVLADPGMGKSTLLRMEAGSTAQKEREKLLNKEITIDEVVFPLFIRLSKLDKRAEKIIDAISILIEEDYPETFLAVNNLLKEKLSNGKCLLLFDALDEVPKARRIDLADKLNRFVRNYRGQIICTSRIVGYGGTFVEGAKEVEIFPFSQKQTEDYIEIWFKNAMGDIEDNSISAERLIQELRNKPQIWGLAQNPLLLSLLCSLYQEKGLMLPARRCQVYTEAVEYMLGKWGIENRRQSPNEARVSAKKHLLEELAYQFSCEGKEIFSIDELTSKIENYLRSENVRSDFRNLSASSLICELSEQDGILQKLAREGNNYLFLHRTFQEYFTACYLKKAHNSLALAREHFWEYDWHETLSLMAGLMLDPIPLLKAIIEEKDDRLFSLLLLAVQCVTECEQNPDFSIEIIIDKILELWYFYPSIDFIRRAVVKLIRSNPNILNKLLQKGLKNSSREIKCETVRILGEINTVQVIEPLTKLINHHDNCIKKWSVVALGKIGGARAIETLIKARGNQNTHVRNWIFNVLVKNSNPQIVNTLSKEVVYSTEHIVDAFNIDELDEWNIANFNYSDTDELFITEIYNLLFLSKLIKSLYFLYSDVRKETVIALGEIGTPEVIEVLIQILHPLDSDIKSWVVAASEKFNNAPPVETIIQFLTQTLYRLCSDVRKEAAVALGKIGDPRAVKLLSEALNDPEINVRREATIALGKIGDPKAVEVLSKALKNSERDIRREATIALGKIGDPKAVEVLSKAFNDPNSDVRREAAVALGATASSQAFKTLIKALDDQDNDVRWWVAAALGEISSPKAIEVLIQALNCPDSDVRREATVALGKIGSLKAVEVLIQALNNPDTEARRWAAVALAKVRWSAKIVKETKTLQVFDALIHALNNSDSYLKRWAVVALGRIRNPRAVEALIKALKDRDSDVRKHAAIALGRIRNPQAVEALIQALDDDNSDVKKQAAVALGRIRAPQAVKELIRILNSPDNAIRMWFAITLVRIEWTLCACARVRNLPLIEVLVQSLDPPDTELRWRAASALGEIGGAQAVKGLIRSLSDPNSDIRGLSAAALGKIGDSLAIRALVQALSHPDKEVKKEAVEALKQISGVEALKYLIEYPEIDLYDPDILPLARTLVIRAKTNQKKPLFVSIFPKKLKLIDSFFILYRQLSRFFL